MKKTAIFCIIIDCITALYAAVYCANESISAMSKITEKSSFLAELFSNADTGMIAHYLPLMFFGTVAWMILIIIFKEDDRKTVILLLSFVPNHIIAILLGFNVSLNGHPLGAHFYRFLMLWLIAGMVYYITITVKKIRASKTLKEASSD